MSLLERSRSTLEGAGYETTGLGMPTDQFAFEDNNVFGLVAVFSSTDALLDNWEKLQENFLRRNSRSMTAVPEKAWNAYAVFLSAQEVDETTHGRLLQIEEDFRGARKIARAGVRVHDLEATLAPLLPVRIGETQPVESILDRIRESPAVDEALIRALEDDESVIRLRDLFLGES